jgi:hypothetical protein
LKLTTFSFLLLQETPLRSRLEEFDPWNPTASAKSEAEGLLTIDNRAIGERAESIAVVFKNWHSRNHFRAGFVSGFRGQSFARLQETQSGHIGLLLSEILVATPCRIVSQIALGLSLNG